MHKPETWLVAGLGNPGEKYAQTRHNIGFMVADLLGERLRVEFAAQGNRIWGVGKTGNVPVGVVKPQSYMNLSGPPIWEIAMQYGIDRGQVLVIHDDLDLPFGKIKIKTKGGHGGHKGIQSLIQSFGDGDFPRLRVGIGRPPAGNPVIDHVLGRFDAKESFVLGKLLALAGDAVETILREGVLEGMNLFNNQQITA
ncbi:MAG: aminoacyl-tRNA hydrolase [Desulfatibacillum sp.]|nr:aminoacyl-tRNA hydrolase [Desulfatibacillum sp.]